MFSHGSVDVPTVIKGNPVTTVMLNTYNQADSIEAFIRKLCQVDMIRNIMIFDNGSTDGTCEIIKEIQKKNNRVIFEENIK